MEKPEIIAGIKNAVARGYSLEQAKQSFINSGYNAKDVEDSASTISGTMLNFPEIQNFHEQTKQLAGMESQNNSAKIKERTNFKSKIMLVIILILAIILLSSLAVLAGLVISPESTKSFLESLFG